MMNFSEEKVLIILLLSLAVVSSYMFICRTFWPEDEAKEADLELELKKDGSEQTLKYIKDIGVFFGIFALGCWAILYYLFKYYY
jgi:lysylphosphatidylglycerol synthetase-like protein (DUF2156 family)